MANLTLFKNRRGARVRVRPADAVNEAGGDAYRFDPEHELAQYALTGCFNGTFYADAAEQLERVLRLAAEAEPGYLARLALYARREGYLKDVPALLCAVLTARDGELFERVAPAVIDNAKMLRTFVQIMRSGATGRKSLGTRPKRFVRAWLERQGDEALFRGSVGRSPSLADVVKMVHPVPADAGRAALYAYLLGKDDVDPGALPELVRAFEAFKADRSGPVPDVPFQMLTALPLTPRQWCGIAREAGWQMTRMNLNTFARHGVFQSRKMRRLVAERLRSPALVERARVFPYQLLMAYRMAGAEVPAEVREALQDAMELATANVPEIPGQVYVCPDTSGSMSSPVTGSRPGATTKVRCVDVAALFAAAVLRVNPTAEVLPFMDDVVKVVLNPRDSVMTNADVLSNLGWGGTNCSAPLVELNRRKARGDLVVFVSDNESWVDSAGTAGRWRSSGTAMMREWEAFRSRNPRARLVCIDIQPYGTTQAHERADILNVGGFSDQVFRVVAAFAAGHLAPGHWTGLIKGVRLP